MEWISAIRKSLDYIEEHLLDSIDAQDVAGAVYLSPMIFQKGFSLLTGYSVSEYIRSRRLYQAALEIRNTGKRIIDLAYDYGYDTPESFSKAFSRFHGITPIQARSGGPIRTFLPLTIEIKIQGGNVMNYKITRLFGFRVIGFARRFSMDTSYSEIPAFWDEICEKVAAGVYAGNPPATPQEKALVDNCIGEYGVCIDDPQTAKNGEFTYMIAGKYTGGEVPEGMTLYEFPSMEWAVFNCIGPIPEALQSMNTRIFREWLPGNPEYELCGNATVEWYDCINGEKEDPDYHSAIWIPIRRKNN